MPDAQPTLADTLAAYRAAAHSCRSLFAAKLADYGASWTVLRPSSATDQLYIKARRIRTLEETGQNHVGDSIQSEYQGIVNYSLIAMMLLDAALVQQFEAANYRPDTATVLAHYDRHLAAAEALMLRKNADYGEAWREMRLSSITDIILMRLVRIRQLEDNGGLAQVSEGIDANYLDMVNYALFALIRLAVNG